jgi:hypothetical protein
MMEVAHVSDDDPRNKPCPGVGQQGERFLALPPFDATLRWVTNIRCPACGVSFRVTRQDADASGVPVHLASLHQDLRH